MKTIKIEVYGGCVTEVTGLPEGYDYEIIDHDHKDLPRAYLASCEKFFKELSRKRQASSTKRQASSSPAGLNDATIIK